MKRKKVNSKTEEKIITAMIVSKDFLSQMSSVLKIDLLTASHFKTIARWCIKYFNKYHKAPEHHIENIYHSWVEKGKAKEETVDAVNDILEKLSGNYEKEKLNNIPYLIDQAAEYLNMRNYERLRDDLDTALLEKDTSIAVSTVDSFRTVVLGSNRGIDILNDDKAWENAYGTIQKPLFNMGSKDLNFFFAHAFARDNLIGIEGRDKIGKTFWCVEFFIRALMARRKVALFEVGDLSKSQIIRRFGVRLSKRPMYKKHLGEIRIPTKIIKRKNGKKKPIYRTQTFEHIATKKSSELAKEKFKRRYGISSKQPFCMTSVHPNYSINVSDINNVLDRWEIENDFVPDVIIIDYADILADEPNTGNYSTRDKENVRWMALRRLSQEKHSLVIVPTQADAKSYDVETLSAKNFSEDKRKLAHVTGMLGLNQNINDKRRSIMRLNWIVLREAPFDIDHCLYVGQCLKLGKAFCCGYY